MHTFMEIRIFIRTNKHTLLNRTVFEKKNYIRHTWDCKFNYFGDLNE